MDVQKIGKIGLNQIKAKKSVPTESISFQEVMGKSRQEMVYEKLTKLVQDIEEQGKVLAESRTIDELRKYKKMVKQFMDEAVQHGLQLEERRGFNRRGRTKIYKIVKEVDKKLIELTNTVLDKEQKSLDILSMVGEIKGLLINIYT
ncbi:YaaR family protein [Calidifontibacillus erzurumensis]|uniref:YaaR family protein n=1 Tax=Calidifontibacillus erzurumensis TaxID=2741433 RepID=A0A8J8KBC0_9BACI|nr:YaaR family protein [Calidifontibacillus erzurumensis]NSL51774.1 YaaR family protein [Calidifontibacillus erzurumensis]